MNNLAVGYSALASMTTGICNTAVGYNTLAANMIGACNTAVGYDALANCTIGNNVINNTHEFVILCNIDCMKNIDPIMKNFIGSYKHILYIMYDKYTQNLHQILHLGKNEWRMCQILSKDENEWKNCTDIYYYKVYEKSLEQYNKMMPRWLELYRCLKQEEAGLDIFKNVICYYIYTMT